MVVVSGNVTFPLAPNANVSAEDDYRRYHQPLTPSGYDRVYAGVSGQTDTTAAPVVPTLTDKAVGLRMQVDRCHQALDSIGWMVCPELNEKDPTEPGLAAHLQWTEASVANLLNRLNTLAEYLGRL